MELQSVRMVAMKEDVIIIVRVPHQLLRVTLASSLVTKRDVSPYQLIVMANKIVTMDSMRAIARRTTREFIRSSTSV